MKKKLAFLVLVFVMVLALANSNVLARTIIENVCEQDDLELTWSGTWKHEGTDGYNNPGTNLIDGDYFNKWGSNDILATGEEWVQFSFAEPVEISSFIVYQESSGVYTNILQFTFQVLNEEGEWEIVYTSPLYDEFWIEEADDFEEPVTTKTIRFHVSKEQAAPGKGSPAGEIAIELSEIELFQKIEIEDTPTPEPTATPDPSAEATKAPVATNKTTDPADKASNLPLILGSVAAVILVAVIVIAVIRINKNKSSK